MSVTLRPLTTADVDVCGRITSAAFQAIAELRSFPTSFHDPNRAIADVQALSETPDYDIVVAERGGQVVGMCATIESDSIHGVRLIVVDPAAQGDGIGRLMMERVLKRAEAGAGVRLVQESYNTGSMALYASLGFEVKEPLALMAGKARSVPPIDAVIRPLTSGDVAACAALYRQVHGHDRSGEIRLAVSRAGQAQPLVAERAGRVVAFSLLNFVRSGGPAVAASLADLRALILGGAALQDEPLSILIPTRNAALFRWCLSEGLRVVKPMTLMAIGEYHEPAGAWLPSVIF
jgi:predicted N-acetyltransferase YhbS